MLQLLDRQHFAVEMEINDQRLKMYFSIFFFVVVVISFDEVIFLFFSRIGRKIWFITWNYEDCILLKDELKWEKKQMPMGNVFEMALKFFSGFESILIVMFEVLQPSRFIPINSQ